MNPSSSSIAEIEIIDSHTGGEPTRVVLSGGPPLGSGPLSERRERFKNDYNHFRRAIINEPRGSDIIVGALLCEPHDPSCLVGVIFFNNVGVIGMCGHGTIGVITTLAHLGRISAGSHRIDTPVGPVTATLHTDGRVSVRNVPVRRHAKNVSVDVDGFGNVCGDIAWGGNLFFVVDADAHQQELTLSRASSLTAFCLATRASLLHNGITGEHGAEIDHVELFSPPLSESDSVDARNFVLCPGGAYDRSPCGTGTSAKLSCLYADGKIAPGQVWRQQSITNSVFEVQLEVVDHELHPTITGRAYITARTTLLLDPADPLCWGM